ncbi:MAG: hypothetical protein OSJ83_05570 [Clostridia bacterium]|nr:hypothetical protein [Clostridia bacterium]
MNKWLTLYERNEKELSKCELPNSDLEILQLALQSLYGEDCDGTAMRLFARFGGLGGILNASKDELKELKLTDRAAAFLSFLRPFQRQAVLRMQPEFTIDCEARAVEFAVKYFLHMRNTLDAVVYLDKNNRVFDAEDVDFRLDPREFITAVCRRAPSGSVLIRNLPRGKTPSAVKEFERLNAVISGVESIEFMGFRVVDCITVFGSRFASVHGSARMRPIESASEERYPDVESLVPALRKMRREFYSRIN